jgi:hypothetical protein
MHSTQSGAKDGRAHYVGTGHHLEQLARDMLRGAVAGRAIIELAWIGLGIGNELGNRLGWHRGVDLHDNRLARDTGDRRDVADEIVIEPYVERGI